MLLLSTWEPLWLPRELLLFPRGVHLPLLRLPERGHSPHRLHPPCLQHSVVSYVSLQTYFAQARQVCANIDPSFPRFPLLAYAKEHILSPRLGSLCVFPTYPCVLGDLSSFVQGELLCSERGRVAAVWLREQG